MRNTLLLFLVLACTPAFAAEYGLAAKYVRDQNLAYDPDVIAFWDYEDGENFRYGFQGGLNFYKRDSNAANVLLGKYSIRADLVSGTTGYGDKMVLAKPETCLYQRWYVKFQSGFQFMANGMKNHGFAGYGPGQNSTYPQGSAGIRPDGTDKFYAIIAPIQRAAAPQTGLYYYHPDQTGGWGDMTYAVGPTFEPGKWVCFEMMMKLNDVGRANGELRAWLNGEQVFSRTDLRWRTISQLQINLILDHVYNTVLQNQSIWFDNRVVARKYIGPASGAGPNAAPIPFNPPPVPPDTLAPVISKLFPLPNATGVAQKTLIQFHIVDDRGVDSSSIVMRLNGQQVKPTISGFPKDFTVLYANAAGYAAGSVVKVSVDAKDFSGKVMPTFSYSFTIAGTPGISNGLSVIPPQQASSVKKSYDLLGRTIALEGMPGSVKATGVYVESAGKRKSQKHINPR